MDLSLQNGERVIGVTLRVPHVRTSVHGPITIFQMLSLQVQGLSPSAKVFCLPSRSVGRGCAPSFSAHVRWCEHGAPVDRSL